MRIGLTVVAAVVSVAAVASSTMAQSARAKEELAAQSQKAMEAYDGLEFEQAKELLENALAKAADAGLESDPAMAAAYLNLGIVEYAGLQDEDGARQAFAAAVAIDPAIEIDISYRTDAMAKMLDEARATVDSGGDTGTGDSGLSVGCDELDAIEHSLVTEGASGKSLDITARVGDAVGFNRVSLFYRPDGDVDFTEIEMGKTSGCSYEASIPAEAMRGDAIHYYLAALKDKRVVADRGSRRSPNVVEISNDDPLAKRAASGGGESDKPTVFLSVALGTGGGLVTGQTEVVGSDVDCCLAPALLHLFPEIGYYFSKQMTVSAALRMGFAIGATVPGHATAAPAGLLRLRYALDESGDGVQLSGAVGGGIIRHTVKVEEGEAGMDTDTTASGPILIGAGIGYKKPLSRVMHLVGELNSLAAIPGPVKEIGTCPGSGCVKPHFGVQLDINLGLLVAF